MRYKDGPYQYTQREMSLRAARLMARLLLHRLSKGRWLDILITHAPPLGIHDGKDRCHTGFRAFLWFMERCRPRYLLHGHTHRYDRRQSGVTHYHETIVTNVHPFHVLEIPDIGAVDGG